MSENRREHARYPTTISVDYSSGDTFLFTYAENISEMGIFLRSNDPPPVGTRIDLRFAVEGDDPPLALEGEVAWVNPVRLGAGNINPGMGVRFMNLTDSQRERLVEIVRTIAYLQEDQKN